MNPEEHIEIDAETSQIPGLAYALTDNGIELPVLDITHPQFLSNIDESRLDELSRASMQKMLAVGQMSDAQKRTYDRARSSRPDFPFHRILVYNACHGKQRIHFE